MHNNTNSQTNTNLYLEGSSALEMCYDTSFDSASCKKGDIVWVHKGSSENYGSEMASNRPAVVIHNHGGEKVTVVYLTKAQHQLRNDIRAVRILSHENYGVARCDKIQTVDISRIGLYDSKTSLSGVEMAYIIRSIIRYLQKNKNYDELRQDKEQTINRFLERGHAYVIRSGEGEATGMELSHNRPGLIISNTALPDSENVLKDTKTISVSYGITQEEFDEVEDPDLYISMQIFDIESGKMIKYYFNCYELYEVDVKRIDYGNCENYLGKLEDSQLKRLNCIISKLANY